MSEISIFWRYIMQKIGIFLTMLITDICQLVSLRTDLSIYSKFRGHLEFKRIAIEPLNCCYTLMNLWVIFWLALIKYKHYTDSKSKPPQDSMDYIRDIGVLSYMKTHMSELGIHRRHLIQDLIISLQMLVTNHCWLVRLRTGFSMYAQYVSKTHLGFQRIFLHLISCCWMLMSL